MHHEVIMTRTALYYSTGMVRHILAPVSVAIDKVAINERQVWSKYATGRFWPRARIAHRARKRSYGV